MQEKDYTKQVLLTLVIAAMIMVGLVFVPGHTFGGVSIKRANIVSDLIHFEDENLDKYKLKDKTDLALDTSFLLDIPEEIEEVVNNADNIDHHAESRLPQMNVYLPYVPIEDYSSDSMMYKFYRKLQNESGNKVVRIGVCGDSFIEADILTSDLREMLQGKYGGHGVGFVPFSHPLLKYRNTVSTSTIGWTDYSVMKKKLIPEEYLHSMYISGNISVPAEESARSYFKGTNRKKFLDYAEKVNILFKNTKETDMTVTINDSISRTYTLSCSDKIQCITIENEIVNSLCINLTKSDGFIGYGVCFDGMTGVAVDNFSIRGNSGMALFTSDADINSEINSFMNYDLIVLQYGLNVMNENNLNYSVYRGHLKKLINFMRICFPQSAILVMGVSDRGKRVSGKIETMSCVLPMITEQHMAAMETGVAFWNTFNAMGGENSIAKFVNNGMAGKDYTHINFKGGKAIADEIFSSISNEIDRLPKRISNPNLKSKDHSYPVQITYQKDLDYQAIVKADKSRHRITSRRHWKFMRKW